MLRIENICVTLGDFSLENVSLQVAAGTYLVLLGPTGTGKTVFLETIAGLHRPRAGRIYIKGQDITRVAPEKRHLGVVYQDYALFPHLTVFDNIAFGLRLIGTRRREIKQIVEEMAGFLEIGHLLKRRPIRLSGGERQRTALARALAMKPYVLLLDEPLSALDRTSRSRIQDELKRIHTELSVTIVHITHNLTEAFFLADHLAVMKNGRILQEGPAQDVILRPANQSVAELIGIENLVAAVVEDKRLRSALGDMNFLPFSAAGETGFGQICLTIPGWSIELFPEKSPEAYIWQGRMRISDVRQMTTGVSLKLVHDSGESLKASLSMREADILTGTSGIGRDVPVGIRRKGVHWVPRTIADF